MSNQYNLVAEYSGPDVFITNIRAGHLDENLIKLEQADKNFAVWTPYTLRFTPTNPIPALAWVKVVYPKNVEIKDDSFVENCSIQTAMSYKGKEYCILDADTRTIWFKDVFKDQDFYTSEVSMEFEMRNPANNFNDDDTVATAGMDPSAKAKYTYDQSFHIYTYDIDIAKDFAYMVDPTPAAKTKFSTEGAQKI